MKDEPPQVGDVIKSIWFSYSEKDLGGRTTRITVGRTTPQYIVTRHMTDKELAAVCKKTGKIPANKWMMLIMVLLI